MLATLLFFTLVSIVYSFVNVFYVNDFYEVSFVEVPFWLFVYPSTIFYIIYSVFSIIIFIIKTSKFANIRQVALLGKLNDLNLQLEKVDKLSPIKREKNWKKYLAINGEIISLCAEIELFSRFWTPFLTIYFGEQITLQAYFFYICFFVSGLPFLQKFIFLYAVIEINVTLFVVIDFCAKVVKTNRKIEQANGIFYRRFLHLGGFSASPVFIVKVRDCLNFKKIYYLNIFICRQNGCS